MLSSCNLLLLSCSGVLITSCVLHFVRLIREKGFVCLIFEIDWDEFNVGFYICCVENAIELQMI